MRHLRLIIPGVVAVAILAVLFMTLVLARTRAHAQSDWFVGKHLTLAPVVKDLKQPTYVTGPDDGTNRLFILEKGGLVRVADATGRLQPTPLLDLSNAVSGGGEQGLLGLAFHPDFVHTRYLYVDYTALDSSVMVVRYTLSQDQPDVVDPATAQVVLTIPKRNKYHNGGMLAFGPDGYLYVSVGDDEDSDRAQDLGVLTGKILRLDVDSADPYAVPPSNPFVGSDARGEVWSYGLRNPWRFSFDRGTGDMWIGDVHHVDEGPGAGNNYESVQFQRGQSTGGENFGFPAHMFRCAEPANCQPPGVTAPVLLYDHNMNCSVTGGYVYRGKTVSSLVGTYLFGDLCTGGVFAVRGSPGQWSSRLELGFQPIKISSFGEDAAGELYVVDFQGGAIYRVMDASLP